MKYEVLEIELYINSKGIGAKSAKSFSSADTWKIPSNGVGPSVKTPVLVYMGCLAYKRTVSVGTIISLC